jgi:hypothetical protein
MRCKADPTAPTSRLVSSNRLGGGRLPPPTSRRWARFIFGQEDARFPPTGVIAVKPVHPRMDHLDRPVACSVAADGDGKAAEPDEDRVLGLRHRS